MQRHGNEVEVTTTEARGGATPNILRYMLGSSLVLVIVLLSLVWISGALSTG